MADKKWLDRYAGQSVDEILSMEGEYRTDSLVAAFEQALQQKAAREGNRALGPEERAILAVEALEREVNNGGYSQFFLNSSREYASIIVQALMTIGCPYTARITQTAIDALHIPEPSAEAIETAMENEECEDALDRCDQDYYAAGEDLAAQLFAFIKKNKAAIGR